MPIGFSVDLSNRDTLEWMEELPERIRAALLEKMSSVGNTVKAKLEAELSGSILNPHTGHLRDSMNVAVQSNDTSVEATVSSSSPYAGALEYGVHKTEMVPASKREVTAIFGSAKAAILADVMPHSRLQDIRGTHFMMLAAQDAQASFVDEMTEAVSRAIRD